MWSCLHHLVQLQEHGGLWPWGPENTIIWKKIHPILPPSWAHLASSYSLQREQRRKTICAEEVKRMSGTGKQPHSNWYSRVNVVHFPSSIQALPLAGAGGAILCLGLHPSMASCGSADPAWPGLAHMALCQHSGCDCPGISPAHFMVFGILQSSM